MSEKLPFTGERYLPEVQGQIASEHWHRYFIAGTLVRDKVILDVACGEGYGSFYLAGIADSVVGVDISTEAVDYARHNYHRKNLVYKVGSCDKIPLEDSSVDVVVSFETIEHHDKHEEMMSEIKRVLRNDGILIISSPNKLEYSDKPNYTNPYHIKELYKEDFTELLNNYFSKSKCFGQKCIENKSYIWNEENEKKTTLIYKVNTGCFEIRNIEFIPVYDIIIASDKALPEIIDSALYIEKNGDETVNEELNRYNEELKSNNEELNRYNEELNRYNEELNRYNEELNRYNEELNRYNEELSTISNTADLKNKICSINLFNTRSKKVRGKRKNRKRLKRDRQLLLTSGVFDPQFYYDSYEDVRGANIDPVVHYLTIGWMELRDPSDSFSTEFYLANNKDVLKAGICPLLHYISSGKSEGRSSNNEELNRYNEELSTISNTADLKNKICSINLFNTRSKKVRGKRKNRKRLKRDRQLLLTSGVFDPQFYYDSYEDVRGANIDPVVHYLTIGWMELRDPSDSFSTEFYLANNKDVLKAGICPLLHYISSGKSEGRSTEPIEVTYKPDFTPAFDGESKDEINIRIIKNSPYFDEKFYLDQNEDIKKAGINSAEHYYYHGWKEGRNPSKNFDNNYYLSHDENLLKHNMNPVYHYLVAGEDEGREILNIDIFVHDDKLNEHIYEEKHPLNISTENFFVKVIAFYLPQFHPFKENDEWWGEGFTEWTNVTKAKPQFEGHYQPQLPSAMGFYDLRVPEVLDKQAKLAKEFGVYGFCFHHYYFDGKRLMEKPVDNLLAHPEIDLPFMLCWANENWTRRWDGMENDVLISQNHTPEDDIHFLEDISRYFEDPRYIRIDGKPIFIVYKVSQLPNAKATLKRWRKHWKNTRREELYIVMAQTFGETDPRKYGFDAAVEFPPHNIRATEVTSYVNRCPEFSGYVYSYSDFAKRSMLNRPGKYKLFKTVMPSWDNTARRGSDANCFHGATPRVYEQWLANSIKYTKESLPNKEQFVFVNAWNEWAEGAHLEPCQKYGYAYLNATCGAIHSSLGISNRKLISIPSNKLKVSVIVPNYNHAKYLKERLDSVYNQTYNNLEVIILDDCSSDDSLKIIEKYKTRYADNTKVLTNTENSGCVFKQWAKGVKVATGDLVWIAESDDYCDLNFLETLVPSFEDEAVLLSYSNYDFVDSNGKSLAHGNFDYYVGQIDENKWLNSYTNTAENEVNEALGIINTIPNASGVVFRYPKSSNVLEDETLYSFSAVGDWYFYLHVIRGGKISFIKETTSYFRRYDSSTSASLYCQDKFYKEIEKVLCLVQRMYKVDREQLAISNNLFYDLYNSQTGNDLKSFELCCSRKKIHAEGKTRAPNVMIAIYGFYGGGAEIFPISLANELKNQNYSVLVLSCEECEVDSSIRGLLNCDIPVVVGKTLDDVYAIVKEYKIDVINSHHWHFQQFFTEANIKMEYCKHLATMHGHIESGNYHILDFDLQKADNHVDHWIYTAEKNLSLFNKYGINIQGKVTKLPNGTSSKINELIPRKTLGISENSFIVCCVSRAIKSKGWNEVINVVDEVRRITQEDIQLILVGNGEEYDRLISTNIPDYLHLPGFDKRCLEFYHLSNVGILLSTYAAESFPISIIQCLAAHKPCIASDIGEIGNILK